MERERLQSLTANLTAYYRALFRDVAWLYRRPSDMMKDQSRFSHELAINGSRFATLDLPALGKHFDMCLDQGLYTPSRLAYGRCGRTEQVPVLLRDLLLQVFDTEGKLRPIPRVDAITALRMLYIGAKKIGLQCEQKRVLAELRNYERIEHETHVPTLNWVDDVLDVPTGEHRLRFARAVPTGAGADSQMDMFVPMVRQSSQPNQCERDSRPSDESWAGGSRFTAVLLPVLDRVCGIVFSAMGDFSQEEPTELPKHGPGVTAEMGRRDDKFLFPNWPLKLENTFPYDLYGSPNMGEHARSYGGHYPGSAEVPSRIIAVPKTQKAPRLIAAEPTAHQWIQQLVWTQLENRLRTSPIGLAIHFRDQSVNQQFARKGSIGGSFATVDLSSASDRLSCWVVERAMGANPTLLRSLHSCRTRWTSYKYGSEQRFLTLRKFAPMGSAATFPVQTIIYACVAATAVLCSHASGGRMPPVTSAQIKRVSTQISVFGDDIVVPSDAVGDLVELLTYMGLRVNAEKTYSRGLFRESCGAEWWNGHDVSVPYLVNVPAKSTFTTLTSKLEERNNFYARGYWATARWLGSWIRDLEKIPSAHLSRDEPGLLSVTSNGRRLRFSKRFHRFEEYCLIPHVRETKVPRAGWSSLMLWLLLAERRSAVDHRRARQLGRTAQAETTLATGFTTPERALVVSSRTPVPVFSRTELVKTSASLWKLGWYPCRNPPTYYLVKA